MMDLEGNVRHDAIWEYLDGIEDSRHIVPLSVYEVVSFEGRKVGLKNCEYRMGLGYRMVTL